jgi:ribosomal protein L12E/L44/L45/RPP1/RPP2
VGVPALRKSETEEEEEEEEEKEEEPLPWGLHLFDLYIFHRK